MILDWFNQQCKVYINNIFTDRNVNGTKKIPFSAHLHAYSSNVVMWFSHFYIKCLVFTTSTPMNVELIKLLQINNNENVNVRMNREYLSKLKLARQLLLESEIHNFPNGNEKFNKWTRKMKTKLKLIWSAKLLNYKTT